jgi:hypothetical protein
MKPIAFTEWNIQAVGAQQNVSDMSIHAAKLLIHHQNKFGSEPLGPWQAMTMEMIRHV